MMPIPSPPCAARKQRGATDARADVAAAVLFITFYAKSSEHFSRIGFTLGVVARR
jgi:hypothetical protein